MRQHFRIYGSWTEETAALDEAEKGRLIDSLVAYIKTGEERPPEGNERFIYPQMIERIKREQETHEKTKARRAAEREANS